MYYLISHRTLCVSGNLQSTMVLICSMIAFSSPTVKSGFSSAAAAQFCVFPAILCRNVVAFTLYSPPIRATFNSGSLRAYLIAYCSIVS